MTRPWSEPTENNEGEHFIGTHELPPQMRPVTLKMKRVLDTIADAKTGEISGWSVAKWLNSSRHPEGVREQLRALTNRGLIIMRPMDDPPRQFPDRLKAMYSIAGSK